VPSDETCALITIDPHSPAPFDLRELWAARELLSFLVWRDVTVRYRQTLVGIGWAILQPLLAMLLLSVVFGGSARLPSDGVPYPLFAYAGLLTWTFFSNAVSSSSNSLVGNAPLITKIYFPRLVIPFAAVAARLVDFGITFLLLIPLFAWYRVGVTSRLLLLPALVVVTMALAFACGLLLSALNVKYRDVNVALPHVLQFVLFATPVFYSSTMLPAGLRSIAMLNPLAVLIDGYRAALFGRPFDWPALLACVVFAMVLLVAGVMVFRRMEEQFPDLV
jgi:lipopolysaccharide transport system permease protein